MTGEDASQRPARAMGTARRAVGIIGATTMAVALAVMFSLGLQAAELPASPTWTWRATNETDVWRSPRGHFQALSWAALGVSVAGWILLAIALPVGGPRIRPLGRRARWAMRAVPWVLGLLAGAATLGSLMWSAELSRPFALAMAWATASTVCLLGSLAAWWESGHPRRAWVVTGLSLAVAGAVVATISPLVAYAFVRVSAVLWSLLARAPEQALAVGFLIVLAAPGFTAVASALLVSRALLTEPAPTESGAPRPERAVAALSRGSGTSAIGWSAPAVLVIVLLGTWATLPGRVPAPAPAPARTIAHEPVELPGSRLPPEDPGPWVPPEPETIPARIPPCTEDQLEVSIGGWSGMMGDTGAMIEALNVGDVACGLTGRPTLAITQGGEPIELRHELLREDAEITDPAVGAVLATGETARAGLYWPGYRNAADQETPQQATVHLSPGSPAMPADLGSADGGGEVGPAPFDIKAGIDGGAEIQVGVWTPAS